MLAEKDTKKDGKNLTPYAGSEYDETTARKERPKLAK